MDTDLALRLTLALAIGLVVGLERGWREREAAPGSRTAGLRTYALTGLLGGIFAAIARSLDAPVLIGIGFLGSIAVFAWFKRDESLADHDYSVTGTVAAMLVFALGALAVVGDRNIAAAAGIATAALLAAREWLHGLVARITWQEMRSTLLLLAMTAIVLPILPDRALDPLGAINLREIWGFTILLAGLSYAGYLGMRILGPSRGILVTALTGGMVSSTAVTITFARRAATGEDAATLAAGAAAAGAVSLLRVLVVSTVIEPSLFAYLAAAAIPAALIFLLPALRLALGPASTGSGGMRLGNPFELLPVVGYAVLLAAIGFAAAFVNQQFGSAGLYPLGAIAGLADVDAFSVSTARLAGRSIALQDAAIATLICLGVNAVARAAYGAVLGGSRFRVRLLLITAAAIVAGSALGTIAQLVAQA
ncbi:MgtC/SapB family protein [Mesorhizobium sp. BR1-1-16]|uniref:MgtC/SapB family protein n=1 Tax=Mesorhizobium sp. BR1-1-16 TaxID=2876653 RepID=UPI001CC9EB85|nr:MgtC/SapB family protein [Mesorhizobium sp. BR1-1-16]MBZ9937943.1 MgtC/SapB family protein [Mesorhizobium sp. BR1-1-16]